MTLGPLVAACGLLLMLRVDATTSWVLDVLPAVLVFGAGLALTVAPLTATVLDAAPDRYAGSASGVNNAVARAAGLLSVAVIPGLAGIRGADYTDPVAFDSGFRVAMMIAAGLLAGAAVLAFALIRGGRPATVVPDGEPAGRVRIENCLHCGVTGPQIHPAERARR
jgi:hypothetical protein